MTDWVITIPKTTKWSDYEKELKVVEDGSQVLNYRTRYFPKEMRLGDKLFVVWNGYIRGWMSIVGLKVYDNDWQCTTTGATWRAGKYIQRSGPFHEIGLALAMKGFRGIRVLDMEEY